MNYSEGLQRRGRARGGREGLKLRLLYRTERVYVRERTIGRRGQDEGGDDERRMYWSEEE